MAWDWQKAYERLERKVMAKGFRDGFREGLAEGLSEAKAEAVLSVLAARKLPVSAAQRTWVLACTDAAVLRRWIRAAAITPSAAALFAPRPAKPPRAKRSSTSTTRRPTRR